MAKIDDDRYKSIFDPLILFDRKAFLGNQNDSLSCFTFSLYLPMFETFPSVFQCVVTRGTFEQLCHLWEDTARSIGRQSLLIKETDIAQYNLYSTTTENELSTVVFRLLILPQFNALLQGQLLGGETTYQITLTFDPYRIDQFLSHYPKLRQYYPSLSLFHPPLLTSILNILSQEDSFNREIDSSTRAQNFNENKYPFSKLKDTFISTINHELRTPLTTIIGLTGTLLHWTSNSQQTGEKTPSLPLEKQTQYLRTIQESSKHLLGLINDILDFSEINSGESVLNYQNFSLKLCCQKVLNLLQEKAQKRLIELEFISEINESQEQISADAERLEQVLLNLVDNGIKFTPAGGKVILKIKRKKEIIFIQILDNGIGISPAQIPLLFEEFQPLDTSHQRIYGGVGLGLALSKQLIELHHGSIEVQSQPGQGSTFTIILPQSSMSDQESVSLSSYLSLALIPDKKSILLIEQDDERATLICQLLTAEGYHVLWLVDEMTALNTIRLLNPALVIFNPTHQYFYPQTSSISHRHSGVLTAMKRLLLIPSPEMSIDNIEEIDQVDGILSYPFQPVQLLQKVSQLLE